MYFRLCLKHSALGFSGDKATYSKTCLKQPLIKRPPKKVFKANTHLMQVKSNAKCSVLLNCIELPLGFKAFVLSIFEWPFKTGFTVFVFSLFLSVT